MSVGDAIAQLMSGSYVLKRRTEGALDSAGRETPAVTAEVTIVASVQPVAGDDLEQLPSGQVAGDFVTVFAQTELVTADTIPGRDADVIVFRGEDYEIVAVEPWSDQGGYWKALAQKARKADA